MRALVTMILAGLLGLAFAMASTAEEVYRLDFLKSEKCYLGKVDVPDPQLTLKCKAFIASGEGGPCVLKGGALAVVARSVCLTGGQEDLPDKLTDMQLSKLLSCLQKSQFAFFAKGKLMCSRLPGEAVAILGSDKAGPGEQKVLIGLLLPAVQKAREANTGAFKISVCPPLCSDSGPTFPEPPVLK